MESKPSASAVFAILSISSLFAYFPKLGIAIPNFILFISVHIITFSALCNQDKNFICEIGSINNISKLNLILLESLNSLSEAR